MGIKVAVFVKLIAREPGRVLVEAVNEGSTQTFVSFTIPNSESEKVHIGKKYILTVEEAE